MSKFLNISELCKKLNLINPKTGKPLNYVLRYWETEFKQLKPKKINNRRYYTLKDIELLKKIKFYLKDQKMSVASVKNILNYNIKDLDDLDRLSYLNINIKENIKYKSKKILSKIDKIKNYGKKNTPQS